MRFVNHCVLFLTCFIQCLYFVGSGFICVSACVKTAVSVPCLLLKLNYEVSSEYACRNGK